MLPLSHISCWKLFLICTIADARIVTSKSAALFGLLALMPSVQAENVLLVDKKSYKVKIADFGLSNALGEATKFQSCVGTTDYSEFSAAGLLV